MTIQHETEEWQITVVDANPREWPSWEQLIAVGVPRRVAIDWAAQRAYFAQTLPILVELSKN